MTTSARSRGSCAGRPSSNERRDPPMLSRTAALSLAVTLLGSSATSAETKFAVDPEAGNNTFSAVFDAAIGERITAVSSAVACTLTVDADGAPDVELGACAL